MARGSAKIEELSGNIKDLALGVVADEKDLNARASKSLDYAAEKADLVEISDVLH